MGFKYKVFWLCFFGALLWSESARGQQQKQKERTCKGTLDCSGHEICVNEKCKLCTDTSECSFNLICKDKKCISCLRAGERCANKAECCGCKNCDCRSGICRYEEEIDCTVDSNCPTGMVCERKQYSSNYICVQSCSNGGTRVCRTSVNLGIDREFCKNGHCITCLKLGSACVEGDLCCRGESCQGGTCQVTPTKKPMGCKHYLALCQKAAECCAGPCKYVKGQENLVCSQQGSR